MGIIDEIFGIEEINGVPIHELKTTNFNSFGGQELTEKPPPYLWTEQPWYSAHCLQSMIPRAFGFWGVMYILTRMGRWKKGRRRVSMIVYRGFYDKVIPLFAKKYRIRRKRRFEVQSKWFVSWQALGCVWPFIWPLGLWHLHPQKNYEHLTLLAAPFVRLRIWIRAFYRPRILVKPFISGLMLTTLFGFFRSMFSWLTPLFYPYHGFWREVVYEYRYHRKGWFKRTSWILTKSAQHRASLEASYETLSNPLKYTQPAMALPSAAELAMRVAEVPLVDDSLKYGKDLTDVVPDAIISFRQFLETAQDAVKDFSLNPYTPTPSSKLSRGTLIDKEDVDTYFIEDWDEDIRYRPQFPPVSEAVTVPKRGGRWTPEPPKVYTFLDKIITRPESVHGENWPQNVLDWKSGTEYRTYARRSAEHMYDDRSQYHAMEGSQWDLDNDLLVEPRFPRIPQVNYLWTRRFADQYWSPEDDWCFTEEEYAEHVKSRAAKVL